MSVTLQAPQGGQLHDLSDKFYKGGQFMPEPDQFAKSKRKASAAVAQIKIFSRPEIGFPVRGKFPVSVIPAGQCRSKTILWADGEEEAVVMRSVLRSAIEARVGVVDWGKYDSDSN